MATASLGIELDISNPRSFRMALERRGGLFAEFGRFLSLRTDLLPWDFAAQLEGISPTAPPASSTEFSASFLQAVGAEAEPVSRTLEAEPLWSNLCRCAYRARYQGAAIVVQASRAPQSATDWAEFRAGITPYRNRQTIRAVSAAALDQFEDWFRLAENLPRERSYLESLANFKGRHAVYPVLIPELSKGPFLCWYWPDATPLLDHIAASGDAVPFADYVLEQITFLAIVDADLDPRDLAIRDNRIVVRRAPRLVSLPTSMAGASLRYISSVLQRDSRAAARVLASLATTEVALESRLTDKLSNLEPELKVDLRLSAPAAIFENNWRALTAVYPDKGLFLDAIHRNLLAVAFRNPGAKVSMPEGSDPIEEAYWPVLARIFRNKLDEFSTTANARLSIMTAGTAMLEGIRIMQQAIDAVRDDDLRVNLVQPAGDEDQGIAKSNRRTFQGIVLALLLLLFLVAIRWSGTSPELSVLFVTIAVLSGAALLWFLVRGE